MSRTPTYKTWAGMKNRCYNPLCGDYKNYGARGIAVCERWHDFQSFLEDMGIKPAGMSIERLDNEADYSPGNCVWATKATQSRNRRFVHLNAEKAEAIRAGRRQGKTYEALAQEFGTSISHAHRIVKGQSWADTCGGSAA